MPDLDLIPLPERAPEVVNPAQRRLLAYLEGEPGRSLQEVAEHLGVTRTAAVYHLRRLERKGLVNILRQGNRRLHFPRGVENAAERNLLATFRLRNARLVAQAIQHEPEISWRALAKKLRLAAHTVRWHVNRMEEGGLVRVVEQAGRRHVIALHPELQQALREPAATEAPAGDET